MKYLAVLMSVAVLAACGGGGSGGPDASASQPPASASSPPVSPFPAVSPANAQLAKYEGVWRKECDNHMQLTMTATATTGTTFSVTRKEEYFNNADCTGALVATGSFGQPDEAVQYTGTLANASVTLQTGEIVIADVEPATAVLAKASFTFEGDGVKSTYDVSGTAFARIEYADGGYAVVQRAALIGQTTHGALLLRNGELLALVPIGDSTSSFQVNHRYIR